MLLLAVAYFTTGWLGLRLAIAPGYATPIWPPSGVALAAVLLLGPRCWPGILVGSASVTLVGHMDVTPNGAEILAALIIGVGASLQAISGAWLVRRFAGFPAVLSRSTRVLAFLSLGGPASCFIGATVGSLALRELGLVPRDQIPSLFWTWWAGDTIGVLSLTPVLLIWRGDPHHAWRRGRFSESVPLLVSYSLMVLTFLFIRSWEKDQGEERFEDRAVSLSEGISSGVDGCLELLHSMKSLFESTEEVDADTFASFAAHSLERNAGILAMEWIPRVPHAERTRFEQDLRRSSGGSAGIIERLPDGTLSPARERLTYYPVRFVEPLAGNEHVRGLDLASEPMRLEALSRAAGSETVSASASVQLVQDEGAAIHERTPAVLLFLRVDSQEGSDTPPGFALGVVRIVDLIEAGLPDPGTLEDVGIQLKIRDRTGPGVGPGTGKGDGDGSGGGRGGHATLLYDSWVDDEAPVRSSDIRWVRELDVGGRLWELAFHATEFDMNPVKPWPARIALGVGVLFSGLIGAFLFVSKGRTIRVEQLVSQRTQELATTNASLLEARDGLEQRMAELREARDAAESANKAKSAFLANMSHELRTPLTSVIGFSSVLLRRFDGERDENERVYLERIRDNGSHLLDLINGVLDLAKIEAGETNIRQEQVDLRLLVQDVVGQLEVLGSEKGVRIAVNMDPGELQVRADPQRLKQVLLNLLDNSLKFTRPGGHIEVRVATHDGLPTRMDVVDDGVGIDPDKLDLVFEAFRQAQEDSAKQYSGTGLGLSIARHLCSLMGFRLAAASEAGRGATFSVLFDEQAPDPVHSPPTRETTDSRVG